MSIEELQKEIEFYYKQKNIALCRFNALEKIIKYIRLVYKDDTIDITFLTQIEKQKLKLLYENQKENKKLNKAENQAINDIYNHLMKNKKDNLFIPKAINNSIPQNNNKNYKQGLEPWIGKNPKILILGSMPGDESIRQQTYYADISHNSFWKIMYSLFMKKENQDNKEFITSHNIALWDCVQSGIRIGSLDNGFNDKTVIPNDLESLINQYPTIKTIILNGKGKTYQYYRKFFSQIKINHLIVLDSTSNTCSKTFDYKKQEWAIIKDLIKHKQ